MIRAEGKGAMNRYVIFGIMLVSTMVGSLLQTALSTLLPSIMGDFSISAVQAQWLSTAYSLVMGIIIPASAFLLRRFRTKALYMTSLALFLLGSLLCGIAGSFPVMLAGRILQALSSGLSMSMLQVVVLTIFPKKNQGTAMGVYGIAASVAPAFAPTLAGFIAESLGWRAIFTGAAAITAAILIAAFFLMRNVLENERVPFDTASFVLCGTGFAGITIAMGNIASSPFFSAGVGLPLAAGLAALILFVRRQNRAEKPFLNLRVLGNARCRAATVVSMILYAALIAGSTLTPMFQQMVCGLSPSVSGLIMMPGSLIMAVISPLTGRWYDRHGIRGLALGGAGVMLASSAGYCLLGPSAPVPALVILFILRNVAVGCTMMPMVTWGMSTLEKKDTSHGTAILTSLRTIAGGVGSALLVSIMSAVSASSGAAVTPAGMRAAFIAMAALALIQMIYILLFVRDRK